MWCIDFIHGPGRTSLGHPGTKRRVWNGSRMIRCFLLWRFMNMSCFNVERLPRYAKGSYLNPKINRLNVKWFTVLHGESQCRGTRADVMVNSRFWDCSHTGNALLENGTASCKAINSDWQNQQDCMREKTRRAKNTSDIECSGRMLYAKRKCSRWLWTGLKKKEKTVQHNKSSSYRFFFIIIFRFFRDSHDTRVPS